MWSEVVVRRARRGDERQRAAIIEEGFADKFNETFIYFLCQELTLQCCVLAGAILFIFVGSGPVTCALVLPAAALTVAAAVYLTHYAVSTKHIQDMRSELIGYVAEARVAGAEARVAGAGAGAEARGSVVVRIGGGEEPEPEPEPERFHSGTQVQVQVQTQAQVQVQVVGTVSVSRYRHPRRAGWLHELAVTKRWRRRGVGAALARAACAGAAAPGARLEALEALTSDLQPEARALLHALGWQLRGTYRRAVVCSAVTLPMAHLGLELHQT